jgi:ABC-type multidrug transport system ATPase subunit
MRIILNNIGKRYNREWIFRNVNLEFEKGCRYAILGPNGSGKSTLLQTIAGNFIASEGNVIYNASNEAVVSSEDLYHYLAICAPYMQLIEEFSLYEMIAFHTKFKPLVLNSNIVEILMLSGAENKQIRHFSSGMKQRVKLGLAMLSDVPVVILDEPLTNLDEAGKLWYYNLIEQYGNHKTILIGSNRPEEYPFAGSIINISDYKV